MALILPLQCYVGETVHTYFEDAQNGDFSKTERGTDIRKPEPNSLQSLGKDFMNLQPGVGKERVQRMCREVKV